jgi:hypothetical protein
MRADLQRLRTAHGAWQSSHSRWLWVLGLIGLGGFLVAFRLVMTRYDWSSEGDQLTAAAAILGGIIGAFGTALAVYLALAAQRADEAQKVEAALRIEVSEMARLALGNLGVCEMVLTQGFQIPLRDLPTVMAMPDVPVFKATADRLSRLAYGALIVVMHARIAEALQMIALYAFEASSTPTGGPARLAELEHAVAAHRALDAEKARTLATAWSDVCSVARSILARDPSAFELPERAVAEVLTDLETARTRVAPLINPPESPPVSRSEPSQTE